MSSKIIGVLPIYVLMILFVLMGKTDVAMLSGISYLIARDFFRED